MSGGEGSKEWKSLVKFKEMLRREADAKRFSEFTKEEMAEYKQFLKRKYE